MIHFNWRHYLNDSACLWLEYKCKDGKCINKEWLCDGIKDCPNGDDEEAKSCGQYLYFINAFHRNNLLDTNINFFVIIFLICLSFMQKRTV